MAETESDGVQQIFKMINEYFAEEIGPVAPVLCQEAKNAWFDQLRSQSTRPSLHNLDDYIDLLKAHIDNELSQRRFDKNLKTIKALSYSSR